MAFAPLASFKKSWISVLIMALGINLPGRLHPEDLPLDGYPFQRIWLGKKFVLSSVSQLRKKLNTVLEKLTPELHAVCSKAETIDAFMSLLDQVAKLTEWNSQLTEQSFQLSEQFSLATEQYGIDSRKKILLLCSVFQILSYTWARIVATTANHLRAMAWQSSLPRGANAREASAVLQIADPAADPGTRVRH